MAIVDAAFGLASLDSADHARRSRERGSESERQAAARGGRSVGRARAATALLEPTGWTMTSELPFEPAIDRVLPVSKALSSAASRL